IELARRGCVLDRSVVDALQAMSVGGRELAGPAILRATDLSGISGKYGGTMTAERAASLFMASGDFQSAMDTGGLAPNLGPQTQKVAALKARLGAWKNTGSDEDN